MTLLSWLQIAVTLLIGGLISVPVGRYLARVSNIPSFSVRHKRIGQP